MADRHRRRGVFLLEVAFPVVFAVFAARHVKPMPPLMFGVELDFSNYDVLPPSVRLVDPITRERLKASEVIYKFPRAVATPQSQDILQAFVDEQPFLCLQGVREYHECSAHSGDPWLLLRRTTTGSLVFLLEILANYGTEPIQAITPQIQHQLAGYNVNATPPP